MYKTVFPCIRITRNSFKNTGFLKQFNENYNFNRTYLNVLKVKERNVNIRSISYENEVDSNYLETIAEKDLFFDMIDGSNISLIKELLYSKSNDPIILKLNKCENQEQVSMCNYSLIIQIFNDQFLDICDT